MSGPARNVDIHLNTALKGTGLKDGEQQLENVDDAARGAARSMNAAQREADDLEKALRDLSPDSLEFQRTSEQLGQVRKEIQLVTERSDEFAKKSGGVTSATRNWGMATLEVSRAFEDAQYGMRGMLNNIPGLVMMLGGSGGLAGVVSLVAVALSLLGDKFGSTKDKMEDTDHLEKLTERLKKISEKSKELAKEREALGKQDMADIWDAERAAIESATRATLSNIDAMKRAIESRGAFDRINTDIARGKVDEQERSGAITPEEAAKRRADLEKELAARDLARTKELIGLKDQAAQAEAEGAKKEIERAARAKEAAEAGVKGAEQVLKQLEREQYLRTTLNTRLTELEIATGALDKMDLKIDPKWLADHLKYLQAGLEAGTALDPEKTKRGIERIKAYFDALEKFDEANAADPRASQAIAVDRERVNDRLDRLQTILGEAIEQLKAAVNRSGAADEAAKEAMRRNEDERRAADRAGTEGELGRADEAAREGGQDAAEKIRAVFEKWVQELGVAAEGEKPQALIEQVRDMLKDGLQQGEAGKITEIAGQIASILNRVNSDQAAAFRAILNVAETQNSRISGLWSEIRRLQEEVKNLAKEKNK